MLRIHGRKSQVSPTGELVKGKAVPKPAVVWSFPCTRARSEWPHEALKASSDPPQCAVLTQQPVTSLVS